MTLQKIFVYRLSLIFILCPLFSICQQYDNTELTKKGYLQFVSKKPMKTNHDEKYIEYYESNYRNKKYKFRLTFVDNWEVIKGNNISILIGNVQRDSGKTISVGISEYNEPLKNYIPLSEKGLNQFKKFTEETVSKLQNKEIKILQARNGYLCNYPALISITKEIERTQNDKIEFYNKTISCIANGILYTISFSEPLVLFDKNEEDIFDNFINNFRFEFGLY